MHAFNRWIGYVKCSRVLVARDWGSPFIIKPCNCRHFLVSWYDVLISCVTAFISYVYKICSIGGSLNLHNLSSKYVSPTLNIRKLWRKVWRLSLEKWYR